jgi:hypothetical protein
MTDWLPNSVRYIKPGPGGRWWPVAKAAGQVHAGWRDVPASVLIKRDMSEAEAILRKLPGGETGAATRDISALKTLLDRPSQHTWVTIAEGRLWWCLVGDEVEADDAHDDAVHGHFWLKCTRPWSDQPIDGKRQLYTLDLPGYVNALAGYRATLCEPGCAKDILRIIRNEPDGDVEAVRTARANFEAATAKLVQRLHPKDFELLVDLILARSGWARTSERGGTVEAIDMEVENLVSGDRAFVQVKSTAGQGELNDYVDRWRARERNQLMIFAVHTLAGSLVAPVGERIHLWTGERIAELVVKHGLGDWLASRV